MRKTTDEEALVNDSENADVGEKQSRLRCVVSEKVRDEGHEHNRDTCEGERGQEERHDERTERVVGQCFPKLCYETRPSPGGAFAFGLFQNDSRGTERGERYRGSGEAGQRELRDRNELRQ